MSDLRHTFELKLAAAVTQPQLYAALLGQMALLLADGRDTATASSRR